MGLESSGYSISPPECQLKVSSDKRNLKIKLIQISGKTPVVISEETLPVKNDESKAELLESIYYRLYEGDLSFFNIINTEDFLEEMEEHLARLS